MDAKRASSILDILKAILNICDPFSAPSTHMHNTPFNIQYTTITIINVHEMSEFTETIAMFESCANLSNYHSIAQKVSASLPSSK